MEKVLHIGKALANVADADLLLNQAAVPGVTQLRLDVEIAGILRNTPLAVPAPGTALPVNDLVLDAAAAASNRNR